MTTNKARICEWCKKPIEDEFKSFIMHELQNDGRWIEVEYSFHFNGSERCCWAEHERDLANLVLLTRYRAAFGGDPF